MTPVSEDEVTELLGERVDSSIVERIVATGASVDQVAQALDDIEHEVRFAERRPPTSTEIAEVRSILEELPFGGEDDDSDFGAYVMHTSPHP